jgi:hypothetical protein
MIVSARPSLIPVDIVRDCKRCCFSVIQNGGLPPNDPTRQQNRLLSSPHEKNISINPSGKSTLYKMHPASPRGTLAIVMNVRRDAMDVSVLPDEQHASGRQSRVVLTPRRWCQALWMIPRSDGGKQARSPGRARRNPLKPLRRECRVFR